MKRVVSLFILALLIANISAISFEIKSNYSQGETIITKLEGNFLETISKQDISFYRGHTKIPVLFDFEKLEGEYYFYANLVGKSPGDYSIVIRDIKYLNGAETITEDLTRNFTIIEEIAEFSVNPGFVATNKDFYLEVQNLQESEIEILLNPSEEEAKSMGFFEALFGNSEEDETNETSFNLYSGEIFQINFELDDFGNTTFTKINLSSGNITYSVPISLYLNSTKLKQEYGEKSFTIEPTQLDFSLATNSSAKRIVYIYNDGEAILEGLNISVSDNLQDYVSFSENKIYNLNPEESEKITLHFFSKEIEEIIEGELIISGENLSNSIEIYFESLVNFVPENENYEEPMDPSTLKTCEEMEGIICEEGFVCSESTSYATDGNCCLAECEEKSRGNSSKIVAWAIIVLILAFLIWFYKSKFSKTKNKPDLLKQAKGKK